MTDSLNLYGDPLNDGWIVEAELPPNDLVVLPEATREGKGVYRDEVLTLVKELRASGVDAAFAHNSEARTWSGRKGEDLLVPIVIALGTSGLTTAIGIAFSRWLERRHASSSVNIRIVRKTQADESIEEVFQASGPGGEVAHIIRELKGSGDVDQ